MEKEYTPIEIVDITIRNLSNINVPAMMVEQIGIPLIQSINNLRILREKITPVENAEQIEELFQEKADDA